MKDEIKAKRKDNKEGDFKLAMKKGGSELTSVYSGYKSYDPKTANKLLNKMKKDEFRDDKEIKEEAKGLQNLIE